MYTNIPYICEGEIVSIQSSPHAIKKNIVRYIVKVQLPNGSEILCPNAVAGTIFGGIDDYFQERARASTDDGNSFEPTAVDANDNARIGQRVYVSFIGGSITKPVIICFAQHPNQTLEFEEPEDLKPQAVLKYLGMRFEFEDSGVFRVTHFGAPKVNYVAAGIELPEIDAAGTLGALSGNPIEPDKSNLPAVMPASASKRTFVEFKDAGGLEIRDSLNQLVHVDTEGKKIYIANNDHQGGPQIATNSTDSEYVLLDRTKKMVLINAREIAQIYSFGRRKDVTDGLHSHRVGGDEEITVGGDKKDTILGSLEESIVGDYRQTVGGAYTVDSVDAISFDTRVSCSFSSDSTMEVLSKLDVLVKSAGATLKLDTASIALGAGGVEVLKTLSDSMQAQIDTLSAILSMTLPTSMGPTGLAINSADFIKIQTAIGSLKAALDGITGST